MKNPIPFGKYLLLDRINVGGMAEVFFAKVFGQEGGEQILALKKILPTMVEDEEFIAMFIDEARIAVQLDHPNIVQIFELGKHEENYYIAMEYVAGRDLRTTLDRAKKRKEPVPIDVAAYVGAELAQGLDYAHRAKDQAGNDLHIVHRDVSPQNILISYDGQIKLIDFGIAKAATQNQRTQAGILKGKFGYMSPEQVRGLPIDRRSDIFALGVILYEMITGERLFVGDSDFSILERVRNADVIPPRQINSSVPDELDQLVVRALAREPVHRFQWASEVSDALLHFLGHERPGLGSETLGGYIRQAFGEEVLKEREKMARFAAVHRPVEVPLMPLRAFQTAHPLPQTSFSEDRTARIPSSPEPGEANGDWLPDTNPMPTPAGTLYPPAFDQGPTVMMTADTAEDVPVFGQTTPPLSRPQGKPTVESRLRSGSGEQPGPITRPPKMRPPRTSLALRVGVAALAVLLVATLMYFRKRAPEGTLLITTHPMAGVTVEVDGQEVAANSDGLFVARGLTVGDHLIIAKGPSGPPKGQKVTVEAEGLTSVDILLPGSSPSENADAGGEPGDAGATPSGEQPLKPLDAVFRDLPPSEIPDGALQIIIASDPPYATIFIDNTMVGRAPYVLPASKGRTYVIRAELSGYLAARRRTHFDENQTLQLLLSPSSTSPADPNAFHKPKRTGGQLIISSNQTARVFVDGKATDRYTPVTPAEPLELSVGSHVILLQTDDGKKSEQHKMNIVKSPMNRWIGAEVF